MAPADFTESISSSPAVKGEGRGWRLTGLGVGMGKALQAENWTTKTQLTQRIKLES
jgi:hypothetical protein